LAEELRQNRALTRVVQPLCWLRSVEPVNPTARYQLRSQLQVLQHSCRYSARGHAYT